MRYYVSCESTGYYRKGSLELAVRCPVSECWPSCSNRVVSANTTNTFKATLDKFWHKQDITYNFRAQLQGTGSRSECLYEES